MNPAEIFSKLSSFNRNINLNFGNFSISPSYLQAGAIVILLFLLVLVLAQIRHHMLEWSFKGAFFGIFWGFLLAMIIEGFLLISGKTAVTELIGWKNAPKPILAVLDIGRQKLVDVLGISSEIPTSLAVEKPDINVVIENIQSLTPKEVKTVKSIICQP